MPSNECPRDLLPNERFESFWDALWLGIGPFLCFLVEYLEQFWGHFGDTVGTLWGTLASLWRPLADFFVTLTSFG